MDDYTVNLFSSEDTYPSHFHTFEMDGFTVRIENSLLAEALENLDGKKRDVILRYYSVSYTHLDVYKRQVHETKVIEETILDTHKIENFVKNFAEVYYSWEPVSYTHLDVYKRQPMWCV